GFGNGHERIFRRAAPCDQTQGGGFGGGAAQVREGGGEILEEHDAEARDDGVEVGRREGVGLCVGEDEVGGCAFLLGSGAGGGDHCFGDVHAGALGVGAETTGCGEGGGAEAAADIEEAVCGRGKPGDQQGFDGFEQAIEYVLLS